MTAPLCPRCKGGGIVDTSPPGVDRAPWLQTDTDCPRCEGSGLRDLPAYFIAPDGNGDPYVWRENRGNPVPVLGQRKVSPYLWDLLAELIEAVNA